MQIRFLVASLLAVSFAAVADSATGPSVPMAVDPALVAAIASTERPSDAVARDAVRRPAEELTFLGLAPNQTVVELWPGGGYWTDILGPYLAPHGHYYVAVATPVGAGATSSLAKWRARFIGKPDHYGAITETTLDAEHFDIAPPGSADLVLTFRNLHNWMDGGFAPQALAACFRALKPGGIFGIEEHRGRNDQPQDPKADNGYVREDYAIALAKQAGFQLIGSSEMLANVRGSKDWAGGSWPLPRTLPRGEKNRAQYTAVGEADNFLLKFRKPKN